MSRPETAGGIPNLRWWIAGLLTVATAINYLDRQTFPVVVTEIQRSIAISDAQYSRLQFWFLLAYGLMYLIGGRIVDLIGTRAGFAIMILWWSAANTLHGFAGTVTQLGILRFALGLGEGGGFPGAAKAVSEWFPAKERAFAFGLFNTGSSIGAVVAPPLIAAIIAASNWRYVFFVTGVFGFVWAGLWLYFYAPPRLHPRITAGELQYLEANMPLPSAATHISWFALLRRSDVLSLCAGKCLGDSAWYFFIFWLPKYLADGRGLNIRQIGLYAWIPYAFAGAGSFIGGWLSSRLLRRGWSLSSARKLSLGIGACLMPVSLLITASPLSVAIVFFSTAMFGHQFWSTIMQTLASDRFPSQAVGAVTGMMGACGSFGAMLFNLLVGLLLTHSHGYGTAFLVAGLLHPASFLLIVLSLRELNHLTADDLEREQIKAPAV
jgi:ACS family hexuronate transporter-like MFS transporter